MSVLYSSFLVLFKCLIIAVVLLYNFFSAIFKYSIIAAIALSRPFLAIFEYSIALHSPLWVIFKYSIIIAAAFLLQFMVLKSSRTLLGRVRKKFEKRLESKLKEPLHQKIQDIRHNIVQINDRVNDIQEQREMITTHAGETRKDLTSSRMLFKMEQVHANYRNLGWEHSELEKKKKKLVKKAYEHKQAIDSVNQTVDNTSLWKLIRT